jgi:ribulose-5-phosphate 4-epimerase/fuculose-1-phosphate aldolase
MDESVGHDLRKQVAIACRVVGLNLGSTGHVSARIPGTNEMYLRCRGGGTEGGLRYTDLHDVRQVDFDGEGQELGQRHFAPGETPVHGEVYRARPEVGAVVHAHPYYTLLCGMAGLDFRPIVGGYAPGLARIAMLGVPTYPRAATVTDKQMAIDMLETMRDRELCLLRAHGIVTTGRTVQQAVSLALQLEHLAKITWELAAAGLTAPDISGADYERYDARNPDRPRPPLHRGAQAVPQVERGFMVEQVHRLQETIGLPSWELDEEG